MTEMNDFPASAATPGQAESRTAHQRLHAQGDRFAWWEDYLSIRLQFPHFSNWRIWVYLAWASQPADKRQPATEIELAETILGCTTRTIRNWKSKDFGDQPGIEQAIAWLQAAPLLRYRREIFDALVEVARTPDPKAHADRKLALEMMKDYRPESSIDSIIKVIYDDLDLEPAEASSGPDRSD
jgi:hypothetical protein